VAAPKLSLAVRGQALVDASASPLMSCVQGLHRRARDDRDGPKQQRGGRCPVAARMRRHVRPEVERLDVLGRAAAGSRGVVRKGPLPPPPLVRATVGRVGGGRGGDGLLQPGELLLLAQELLDPGAQQVERASASSSGLGSSSGKRCSV
jgi:hypothetical protein